MKRVLLSTPLPALAALALLAGGCQNALYEENLAMQDQNRQLQSKLSHTNQELATRPDPAQLAALRHELAERDRLIADLQARLDAPQADGSRIPGLDGIEVDYDAIRGEMTMRVPGDVLFASGSTTINKSAEGTLGRIAEILNSEYAGKVVRVEGHTDSDPIRRTANLYNDNRDLSLKRAYAVTKLLEGRGVSPERIETVGHGQHRSLGRGKQHDRRVEIVVKM